ncbi:sporulation lipoprotein, YhcN/YlaJ family [Fontibacillus panacisegetis]|uniref:Sporulation lipoprotein, YhcN/YlaJ family n=1 Tax=Fontibacillus panacisegetis TaxID=670482 RepID=A0A1G7FPF7_9BACL|nr:YhcN/YlaJ family sporulation lipoprotein [Fontibacillus panacisegetis]SDE77719.1 sporulation lipoprotein, YhcN/YlaJ family [Fontibacillus panacisegetis]
MRIWLCLFIMASLLSSCATSPKQASPSPNNQTQSMTRAQSRNYTGNGNITVRATDNTTTNQVDKKAHLENLAKQVQGVKGAHCVVLGTTAIVGIDVDSKLERAKVGSIKYSVAEALRKDPNGAGAIVTADVDLNQRLTEIGNKITQGHPVSGFATELADIIGRIVPQLPSDTIPRENVPQTKSVPSKK